MDLSAAKIKKYSASESRAIRHLKMQLTLLILLPVLLFLLFCFTANMSFSPQGILLLAVTLAIYCACTAVFAFQISREISTFIDRLIFAIADMVHEISIPLSVASGAVQRLKSTRECDETALQELESSCARLLNLHQDLLVLSMWGAPLKRRELSILTPAMLIHSCKTEIEKSFAEKQMLLEFTNEAGPSIIGDANSIKRLLLNLLENSLKYSESGSTIQLNFKASNGGLLITVQDHGPGIPEQLLRRIFDRHFRADEQNNKPGSGLGLAIASEIVEAHSGEINVRKLQPQGVEFSILLPVLPHQHPFDQMFQNRT